MIGRFLRWWRAELAAAIPDGVKRIWSPPPPLLIVTAAEDGGEATVRLRRGESEEALGDLSALPAGRLRSLKRDVRAGRVEVALALPPARAARAAIRLPAAAAAEAEEAIGFEVERATPFHADEIYFGWSKTPSPEGGLDIDLVYTPRAWLADLIARLETAGLPHRRIVVAAADGALSPENLAPPARTGRFRLDRTIGATLATALVLLTAGAWAAQMRAHDAEIEVLTARLDAARAAATAVAAAPGAGRADRLAAAVYRRKVAAPSAVELLDLVTRILPDDAWLDVLKLEEGRIELAGLAADAAALIVRFETHPRFETPAFRAPIVRNRDGRERFLLSVGVVGAGR